MLTASGCLAMRSSLVVLVVLSALAESAIQLGVHLPDAFAHAQLVTAGKLFEQVGLAGNDKHFRVHRAFGPAETEGSQHVTYLHSKVQGEFSALPSWLWSLAQQADSQAGWGVTEALLAIGVVGQPPLRCLELLEYHAQQVKGMDTSSINWHREGATLLTVAVMLSRSGIDFQGGKFEVKSENFTSGGESSSDVSYELSLGDSAVWLGWRHHRVSPVLQGTRRVLVAEFWLGPAAEGDNVRPEDNLEVAQAMLHLLPNTSDVSYAKASMLVNAGSSHFQEANYTAARQAFASAISIDPGQWQPHANLGLVHEKMGDAPEAILEYTKAMELNPGATVLNKYIERLKGATAEL